MKRLSLQWRITLMSVLLIGITCVSTDFLLGETNIPDRKNYDIAELGLSVEAQRTSTQGVSIQRWSTCCWKTPALQSLLTA